MGWKNLTGSDVAYEIVDRSVPPHRVRGPYRLRSNAETELRELPYRGYAWDIRETTSTIRCDDESCEMSEAEWCK